MSFNYQFYNLFNPIINAIRQLGGSGRNDEIEEKVIELMKLTDEEVNTIHRGNVTKLNYLLRWARNYLKRAGLLENSERGVWALIGEGLTTESVNEMDIVKRARESLKKETTITNDSISEIAESEESEEDNEDTWKTELLAACRAPVSCR